MRKYDIAIVGAGLGGLAVAALFSEKKKRIILLESRPSLKNSVGEYESGGFSFSPTPSLSYGFESGGIFQEITSILGLPHKAFYQSPCYQVALPDKRITVYPDWNATLEELRREFPREIDLVAKFYRSLHKESQRIAKSRVAAYIARFRSAAGFIGSYRFSREFNAFLELQSMFFFRAAIRELSFNSLVTICTTSPQRVTGGFTRFAEQLHQVIQKHGNEVRFNEQHPELIFKGRKVTGIRTGNSTIESDITLVNSMGSPKPVVLFLGVKSGVHPVGMCGNVLVLPDYSQPGLHYSLSLADHSESAAPVGMSALTISFCTTRQGKNEQVQFGQHLELVNRIIPFLNNNIVLNEKQHDHEAYGESTGKMIANVEFKQYVSSQGTPLLFKGFKRRLYLLRNEPQFPLLEVLAARKFMKKIA